MSARLVSLKPRLYASFMAVSISRVRLSASAFPIYRGLLSQSTNCHAKPARMFCQPRNIQMSVSMEPFLDLVPPQYVSSSDIGSSYEREFRLSLCHGVACRTGNATKV